MMFLFRHLKNPSLLVKLGLNFPFIHRSVILLLTTRCLNGILTLHMVRFAEGDFANMFPILVDLLLGNYWDSLQGMIGKAIDCQASLKQLNSL